MVAIATGLMEEEQLQQTPQEGGQGIAVRTVEESFSYAKILLLKGM